MLAGYFSGQYSGGHTCVFAYPVNNGAEKVLKRREWGTQVNIVLLIHVLLLT